MSLVSQGVEEDDDPPVMNKPSLMLCPCSASDFGFEQALIIKEISCSDRVFDFPLASKTLLFALVFLKFCGEARV